MAAARMPRAARRLARASVAATRGAQLRARGVLALPPHQRAPDACVA
jgi:hypothetical protein